MPRPYDSNAVRSISYNHVNRPPAGTCVGYLHLEKETTFRISYEVAAWWAQVLVPAGIYNAWVTNEGFRGVRVSMTGTIVSAYTPALFAGNVIGSQQPQYEQHRDVGNIARKVIQPYEYEAAQVMADPRNEQWEPAKWIEPVVTMWHDRFGYDTTAGKVQRISNPSWALHMEAA